jgi:7-cyano-7-deazaguanine synthase
MINKRAICLISGGLDSAVVASTAKSKGYALYFLFINYGQKTLRKEEQCVDLLAKKIRPKKIFKVKLPWLKEFGGSALFDKKISLDEKNFRLEYVPFRNSIFLSTATALAEVMGADVIFIGSTGGDHICPDNSPIYLAAFQDVIRKGTMLKKNIKLVAPLINTNKKGAVKIGRKLKTPFELTWSCHNNITRACGHCSNCKARLEAFAFVKVKDPIVYE